MIVNQILRYGGGEEVKKNLYPSLQSFFLTPFPHNSGSSRFGSQLPLKNLAFDTTLPFFPLEFPITLLGIVIIMEILLGQTLFNFSVLLHVICVEEYLNWDKLANYFSDTHTILMENTYIQSSFFMSLVSWSRSFRPGLQRSEFKVTHVCYGVVGIPQCYHLLPW